MQYAYPASDVNSDIYGDVVGGLEKPGKCCLQDMEGNNYSYIKHLVANTVNAPIIFPKNTDLNIDCGMTTSQTGDLGSFCGAKLPIQDYDMVCVQSSSEPVPPEYTLMKSSEVYAMIITGFGGENIQQMKINPIIPIKP